MRARNGIAVAVVGLNFRRPPYKVEVAVEGIPEG